MFRSCRLCAVLTLTVSVFFLTGCGRSTGSLSGKVRYQTTMLKGGFVSFISTEGQQSYTANIAEDGGYALSNVTAGKFKVVVDTKSLKGDMSVGGGGGSKKPAKAENASDIPANASNPNTAKNAQRFVSIPDKYQNLDTTDVEYEFKGGTQTYDIELK
jgi:hypothetical protein